MGERDEVATVTWLASRQPLPAAVAAYLEHGARDELQARVWLLRDQGDFGWATIAAVLNDAGERRADGRRWTESTARTRFGEPAARRAAERRRDTAAPVSRPAGDDGSVVELRRGAPPRG